MASYLSDGNPIYRSQDVLHIGTLWSMMLILLDPPQARSEPWYCAHQYKNTYSIYIFSAPITLLNTKQQNQWFYIHHLFNGEGRYNQTYPVDGRFDDYELFQVTIGWKQTLCFKNWFNDTRDALTGTAVYTCLEYTDFYRFEIVFSQTNATSFYTNALTLRRLYSDGRQEYLDQTVVLNTISGLRVVPR